MKKTIIIGSIIALICMTGLSSAHFTMVFPSDSEDTVWDVTPEDYIAELGDTLLIRPVELIEMGTQLRESAKRDGVSMQSLVESLGIPDLFMSDMTRGRKIQVIKQRIMRSRFPKLTEWNASIELSSKSITLPENAQLQWNKSLETPGLQLNANLKSNEDVQNLIDGLSSGKARTQLNVLFDLLS